MNRKGQVLVLFVVMLPVFFLLVYVIYNRIALYGEKNNQEDLAYMLCDYYKEGKSISELNEITLKNDRDNTLKVKELDKGIEITLIKEYKDIINKKNKVKTVFICD